MPRMKRNKANVSCFFLLGPINLGSLIVTRIVSLNRINKLYHTSCNMLADYATRVIPIQRSFHEHWQKLNV